MRYHNDLNKEIHPEEDYITLPHNNTYHVHRIIDNYGKDAKLEINSGDSVMVTRKAISKEHRESLKDTPRPGLDDSYDKRNTIIVSKVMKGKHIYLIKNGIENNKDLTNPALEGIIK